MINKINNDLQYGIAVWWLGEFESALASAMGFHIGDSQIDPELMERLLTFNQERANILRIEMRAMRKELKEYEDRTHPSISEVKAVHPSEGE